MSTTSTEGLQRPRAPRQPVVASLRRAPILLMAAECDPFTRFFRSLLEPG